MKILYHIGDTVDSSTIVKRGEFIQDSKGCYLLTDIGKIYLNNINFVDFYKPNPLGTMIKVCNFNTIIILTVPRIFINIGTGFAIINSLATHKLKNVLYNYMIVS